MQLLEDARTFRRQSDGSIKANFGLFGEQMELIIYPRNYKYPIPEGCEKISYGKTYFYCKDWEPLLYNNMLNCYDWLLEE